jgi:aspartate/glutamate racemase
VAVANVCAYKETMGLPAEATQAEINLITGMEMKSTISRLKFWIEFKRKKVGNIHKSHYWLNAKGIVTVRNLLKFQELDMKEVIKTAAAMK